MCGHDVGFSTGTTEPATTHAAHAESELLASRPRALPRVCAKPQLGGRDVCPIAPHDAIAEFVTPPGCGSVADSALRHTLWTLVTAHAISLTAHLGKYTHTRAFKKSMRRDTMIYH